MASSKQNEKDKQPELGILDYQESLYRENQPNGKSKNTKRKNSSLEKSMLEKMKNQEEQLQQQYINLNLETVINRLRKFELNEIFKSSLEHNQNILKIANCCVQTGRNICFYGFGNKQKIINDYFYEHYKNKDILITVQGHESNLSLKILLLKIIQVLDGYIQKNQNTEHFALNKQKKTNIPSLIESLHCLTMEINLNIKIIFHNIDGPNFQDKQILHLCSCMASRSKIQFIVSIDTLFFQSYLTKQTVDKFNFLYFELNTMLLYTDQLNYMKSIDFTKKGNKMISGVKGILESLTETSRELILFILQLIRDSKRNYEEETKLLQEAVSEAKVTSMMQFENELKEAFGHRIIYKHITNDMRTLYKTPYSNAELDTILGFYKNKQENVGEEI